jgi:hypothetical protein
VSLDSLDACIHISDYTELPPQRRVVTAATASHGLRLLTRVRESLTVTVSFRLCCADPAQRRTLLQKVLAWAHPGGLFTTPERPGQQLHVQCTGSPTVSSMTWLDELTLSFTAYDQPFWEGCDAVSRTITSEGTLLLPGFAVDSPVDCTVTNLGSHSITTLQPSCGDTRMTFDGLALAPGSVFQLQTAMGILQASTDGESCLMQRSADSSDFLLAPCGRECAIAAVADQPLQAVFSARGRYL